MIHSKNSLDIVRKALRGQGIKSEEVKDEMMDHYLTEIETEVLNGEVYEKALRKTVDKIQKTNFKNFETSNIYKNLILASFLLVTACSSAFYLLHTTSEDLKLKSSHLLEAPSGWPLSQSEQKISSTFGMRKHPIKKTLRLHKGIDIKANVGESVLATGSGTVEKTGYSDSRGHFIVIKHNSKYSTSYNHLESIKVNVNDFVKKGVLIGTSGNSGSSFGPHLHYEIIESNEHIDPLKYART